MAAGAAALLLAIALISDVKTMKIPNWLTLGGAVGGVAWRLLQEGWLGGLAALGAGIGCMAILFVLYAWKGIGAGDVKLFGALGAWLGFVETMRGFVYSVWVAGLFALLFMLFGREKGRQLSGRMLTWLVTLKLSGAGQLLQRMKMHVHDPGTAKTRFPFMLAVVPGMMVELTGGGGWY